MDAGSRAFVVHLTPHRVRIKIPQWRRQDDKFAALQRLLEMRPGVVCVRVNALAASIVIHCRSGFEIASVRDCFVGLELVLPPGGSTAWARQIASTRRIRNVSQSSNYLVGFFARLLIAIATRRLDAVLRELILEAAVQTLVQQLHRKLMLPPRSSAPRALLVAAAE
jgi:hypothetical protein